MQSVSQGFIQCIAHVAFRIHDSAHDQKTPIFSAETGSIGMGHNRPLSAENIQSSVAEKEDCLSSQLAEAQDFLNPWLKMSPGKSFLMNEPRTEFNYPAEAFDSQAVVNWCPVCSYGMTSSGECDLCSSVYQKQRDQNRILKKRKNAVDKNVKSTNHQARSFDLREEITTTLLHLTDWHNLDPNK